MVHRVEYDWEGEGGGWGKDCFRCEVYYGMDVMETMNTHTYLKMGGPQSLPVGRAGCISTLVLNSSGFMSANLFNTKVAPLSEQER